MLAKCSLATFHHTAHDSEMRLHLSARHERRPPTVLAIQVKAARGWEEGGGGRDCLGRLLGESNIRRSETFWNDPRCSIFRQATVVFVEISRSHGHETTVFRVSSTWWFLLSLLRSRGVSGINACSNVFSFALISKVPSKLHCKGNCLMNKFLSCLHCTHILPIMQPEL